MSRLLDRRTALVGLGTAVALPFLECMRPVTTLAADAAKGAALPKRLAFLYVPNGIHMQDWTPAGTGGPLAGDISPSLSVLKDFRADMTVLTGLTADKARANGDGGGDHARAMSAFLTGCQPRKTDGANIRAGISVDQIAATKMGHLTRFPSLEIGIERGGQAGNCDSGYSCAYSSNLSWRGESTPNVKEVDPKLVFDRLFGGADKGEADAARAKREAYRTSVLDYVLEDANRLSGQLGATDRRKLDEYLTAVREVEQRIARASEPVKMPKGAEVPRPTGIPKEYADHIRLMCDLLVLAFQTDVTRVATFPFANEGSNRPYPFAGVSEGHHDLSHHGNDKAKQAKIATINRFHLQQTAYLLGKLKAVKEGEGTLLDQCMIVYGSGNSDGNAHNHDDLPVVVFGKGGGTIASGRHLRFPKETPVTNLYLSLLERIGAATERLGDSTGKLKGLEG